MATPGPAARTAQPAGETVLENRMHVAADASLPDALRAWLRAGWTAPARFDDPARPLARVGIDAAGVAPAPADTPREVAFDGARLAYFREADGLCLRDADGSYCRFTLADATGPARLRMGGAQPRTAAYLALAEVFRERGWASFHASGVVPAGRDEGARLFLGESGAGKSFRLLAELEQGARAIADDRVWVRVADLLVVPRDTSLRVLPDAFQRYAALAGVAPTRDPDGKFRITFAALGERTAQPTPLREIVLLRRKFRANGRDDTLSRLDFVRLLWDGMGIPLTDAARASAAAVVQRILPMVSVD